MEHLKPALAANKGKRGILVAIILALFAYFLIAQHQDLQNSIHSLRSAKAGFVGLSVTFFIGTYLAAAMVYICIAVHPLPYIRTLLIQITSGFTNRLLPGGFGGLATFARYLVKQGHTTQQAAAIVSINNLLGFVGIMSLTTIVALASHTPVKDVFTVSVPAWAVLVIAGVIVSAAIASLTVAPLKKRLGAWLRSLRSDLKLIAARPLHLVAALAFSIGITISYAAVLNVSVLAIGESISILQTLVVLTIGVAAASITPTPGGIGGAEAGLVAGLASVGIPTDSGLSIALIYRLVTFWLPILPGFVAFRIALKKQAL